MAAQPSSSTVQTSSRDDYDPDDEEYDSEDNNFDGWDSPSQEQQPCWSLFGDEKVFASLAEALDDAKEKYGVDFLRICELLELDFYARTRLVNYIRKHHPVPADVLGLTGQEPFFSDDAYLLPVIEDDPLLQAPMDDWSDDENVNAVAESLLHSTVSAKPEDLQQELRRSQRVIRSLQRQLTEARQELVDYKKVVNKTLGVSDVRSWIEGRAVESGLAERGKRGEDPRYFDAFEDDEVEEEAE